MSVLATALVLALTRAEIIERFHAAPITQASGMVQVWADCGPDLRREYQLPIASFMGDIAKELYRVERLDTVRYREPPIVVHIGDGVSSNMTNVVVKTVKRDDGRLGTRFYIPAPGYVDVMTLRTETVKAFYRVAKGLELTDDEAVTSIRRAFPALRIEDEYADLAAWMDGRKGKDDDERYLKLMRTVIEPGKARKIDVLTFASRLFLYPPEANLRFRSGADCLSFREAIQYAKIDPSVRLAALMKINSLAANGVGHGERMNEACVAYTEFLQELVAAKMSVDELTEKLDLADTILKGAIDEQEQ